MEETNNIKISIDTLYEIKQRERTKPQLQKIEPDFYKNVSSYVSEKKKILDNKEVNAFSDPEKKRISKELDNIRTHVKRIYENREKKIIDMALSCSKAGADVVDVSALLPEEKPLFENLLDQLSFYRKTVFENVKSGLPPKEIQPKKDAESTENHKTLTFIQEVPQFLGRNLETYGPFKKEDIAKLPKEIAKILVEKKQAEEFS